MVDSKPGYCYALDYHSDFDNIIFGLFAGFFFLLLTALIWRIISAIQTIQRYKHKIMIITAGPILDGSYFDNAPNYAKVDGPGTAASQSAPLKSTGPPK